MFVGGCWYWSTDRDEKGLSLQSFSELWPLNCVVPDLMFVFTFTVVGSKLY